MIPHANLLKTHMEAVRVHRERADRLRQRFRGSVKWSDVGVNSVPPGHNTGRPAEIRGLKPPGQVTRPDTTQSQVPTSLRGSPSESKLKSLLRPCLSSSGKRKQRHDRRVSIDPVPRTYLLSPMPVESRSLFYNELDFQRFEEEDELESGSPKRLRVMPKAQDAHFVVACDAAVQNLCASQFRESSVLCKAQAAKGQLQICSQTLQQSSCELKVKNRSSNRNRMAAACDRDTPSADDGGSAGSLGASFRECAQPQPYLGDAPCAAGGTAAGGRQLRPHQLRALKEVQQMDVDELKQKIREVASRRRERLERIGSRGARE